MLLFGDNLALWLETIFRVLSVLESEVFYGLCVQEGTTHQILGPVNSGLGGSNDPKQWSYRCCSLHWVEQDPTPKKKPAKYSELLEVYFGRLFAVSRLWVWGGCDQVCLQANSWHMKGPCSQFLDQTPIQKLQASLKLRFRNYGSESGVLVSEPGRHGLSWHADTLVWHLVFDRSVCSRA